MIALLIRSTSFLASPTLQQVWFSSNTVRSKGWFNSDYQRIKGTFDVRGHSLTIDHGWREVAQAELDFVKRFA